MTEMFKKAKSFNGDLSQWNVRNVTNMGKMFSNAYSFKGIFWNYWYHSFNSDISNVTNMGYVFYGAKSFNNDISRWEVFRVENMQGMFEASSSLFNSNISQ